MFSKQKQEVGFLRRDSVNEGDHLESFPSI